MKEIDFQIQFIGRKAEGGYWGICDGDKIFIHFLERLKEELYKKNPGLRQLLLDAGDNAEKKIKLVFFAQETSVWPSFKSVYDTCVSDNRFSVKLVYLPFYHPNSNLSEDYYLRIYQEKGLPAIKHTEYNLAVDNPDVAFYLKPYDLIPEQYRIGEVDKVVRRCVYIPYGMEAIETEELLRYHYQLLFHYRAWKILSYSVINFEKAVKYGYRNGENYLKFGHPRIDLVDLDLSSDDTVIRIKELAKKRKIVMWNTHFSMTEESGWGSFLIWGNHIIKYVKEHPDIFLVWRPHPLFYKALENIEDMDENKATKFFDSLSKFENIYIDRTDNYLNAFYASDALISDATSLIPEYLIWEKPILYTPKSDKVVFYDKKLIELLYVVTTEMDIENFFDNIKNNYDPMKAFRLSKMWDHLLLQDRGKVGKNFAEYMVMEIISEEKRCIINATSNIY